MAKSKRAQKPGPKKNPDGTLQTASESFGPPAGAQGSLPPVSEAQVPAPPEPASPAALLEDATELLTTQLETANAERLALAQKVDELQLELDPLWKANAELIDEREKLKKSIAEATDSFTATKADLEQRLSITLDVRREQAATIERLQAELDAKKVDALPQVVRVDVLAAAAFSRSPNCNPPNAARLGCELHDAIIAECKKRATNTPIAPKGETDAQG